MFNICKAILRKQHGGIRILTDDLFHDNFRGNSLIHFYSLEKRHKLIFWWSDFTIHVNAIDTCMYHLEIKHW